MKRKYWVILAMLFVVPGLMLTASCAKKVVKPEAAVSKTAEVEKKAPGTWLRLRDSAALAAREKFMKQDVNFAFDSAVLDATAQAILKDKAAWLKSNPMRPSPSKAIAMSAAPSHTTSRWVKDVRKLQKPSW